MKDCRKRSWIPEAYLERGGAMYRTETLLRRQIRVRYPAGRGRIVLRTELDWERD